MADLLVTAMPFTGHVAPMARAVEALTAAGHRVRVYSGARFAAAFAASGAEFVPWQRAPDFDEHDLPATFPRVGAGGPIGMLANLEHVFLRSAIGQAADLAAEWRRRPWAAVLADSLALGGALAAERAGTPWATLSVVPLSMPSRDLPPPHLRVAPAAGAAGRARDAALWAAVRLATTGLRRSYRQVREAAGVAPAGRSFEWAFSSPLLALATGVPGLEAPRRDLPLHVHFIGAFAPPPIAEVPRWWPSLRDSRRRIVTVTQGTFDTDAARLVAPALHALASFDADIVATIRLTAGARIELPPNAHVADRLPYGELLPRTSLMITNGGWGGVTAALACGVPLVVAGADLDKPAIAAAVASAGAGIDLRGGAPSAALIREAVDTLDRLPGYRERARRLGAEFARYDAAALTVASMGRLLRSGGPMRRASPGWPGSR